MCVFLCVLQPDWTVVLGEAALDLCIPSLSHASSSICVLGERNLYCFRDNGQIRFMKKLEYNPSCFLPYASGEPRLPSPLPPRVTHTYTDTHARMHTRIHTHSPSFAVQHGTPIYRDIPLWINIPVVLVIHISFDHPVIHYTIICVCYVLMWIQRLLAD